MILSILTQTGKLTSATAKVSKFFSDLGCKLKPGAHTPLLNAVRVIGFQGYYRVDANNVQYFFLPSGEIFYDQAMLRQWYSGAGIREKLANTGIDKCYLKSDDPPTELFQAHPDNKRYIGYDQVRLGDFVVRVDKNGYDTAEISLDKMRQIISSTSDIIPTVGTGTGTGTPGGGVQTAGGGMLGVLLAVVAGFVLLPALLKKVR